MKNHLLTLATILFLNQSIYSQSMDDGTIAKPESEQITNINKLVVEIKTNLKNYTKTEVINNDSIGYRYVYKKDNELKLINVFAKDQFEDKNVEWFFQNGQLIYSEVIWVNRSSKKIVDHEQYYLNNSYLFACFKNNRQVDANTEYFKKIADDLHSYGVKLIAEN